MNCSLRTDEQDQQDGWNQTPARTADVATRSDVHGVAGVAGVREHGDDGAEKKMEADQNQEARSIPLAGQREIPPSPLIGESHARATDESIDKATLLYRMGQVMVKFSKFVGPGFMVTVAYIDPGNYSTDVAAGAATRFQLLFVVLMSNFFAIVLQSLAIRLGTVTGMNLAEHCRAHLPRWLNLALYVLAEAGIIATDMAEVLGSAIALNLLLKIPLVAGCAITILDVLLILLFYQPDGSMRGLRAFEIFVMALVLGVVVCFIIQLTLITNAPVGEVLRGYLPSAAVVQNQGIYLSCGILGATVMPHSLYLGSGIVQARLRNFDSIDAGATGLSAPTSNSAPPPPSTAKAPYRPSLAAIDACLKYSLVELVLSLSIFALFVNSAILIVAGASLATGPNDVSHPDLFSIYDLLATSLAPAAGTIFALALLLSGTSAGLVCTVAGQMLSEGALHWRLSPWRRRLLTRALSIAPSIVVAAAVGRAGLGAALNATQIALSVVLPFVSAPLVYFTARNRYMTVGDVAGTGMRNHVLVTAVALVVWMVIVVMNVALLVLVGLGRA